MKALRPEYQPEAVKRVLKYAVDHPKGRFLLVVPPGGGKTPMIAMVLRLLVLKTTLRALIVVHRREMVEHHYEHLIEWGIPRESIGVIMRDDARANPAAPIQIASIDTLNRRSKPDVDIVVTDESHRDASPSRRHLRRLYPDAFHLGATATPTRLDGRGLAEDFDEMFVSASVTELISWGYLSLPRIFSVPRELLPDLRDVRMSGREYERTSLDHAVNQRALIGSIVEHRQRIAPDRRTAVFAASVEHSMHIVEQFRSAGVRAAHIDWEVSAQLRKQLLYDIEHGPLDVISNVNILSESWDCLPCKCVILARPTMSEALHIQQSTRCMRPWRNVVPIILDHAGNMTRRELRGPPHLEREWTLANDRPPPGGDAPAKVCAACGSVEAAGVHVCTNCGAAFEIASPILEEKPGELIEMGITEAERAADWDRIRLFAEKRKFPESWALKVYEARYGAKPKIPCLSGTLTTAPWNLRWMGEHAVSHVIA
jgi:DNA repair protein RadD